MTTNDGSSDPCYAPVPDTAMATGSEDGDPGEQPGARPVSITTPVGAFENGSVGGAMFAGLAGWPAKTSP